MIVVAWVVPIVVVVIVTAVGPEVITEAVKVVDVDVDCCFRCCGCSLVLSA